MLVYGLNITCKVRVRGLENLVVSKASGITTHKLECMFQCTPARQS